MTRRTTRTGIETWELAAVALILIIVAVAGFYLGLMNGSTPVTETAVVTTTTTPIPPSSISIGGQVATATLGTSAQSIQFVSQTTGISYPGSITSGEYSANLPNQDTYVVKIHWTGPLGLGSGDCIAGLLPLYYQFNPGQSLTMKWQC
jgi:hypothetical protein